jgi:Tryptophan halogenase
MGFPARIAIVGGGTAGWLAALILQDAAKRAGAATAITLIESSKFGTVGVGEGTTAVFRMMLRHLGLDEFEFLRASEASFKLGIRHKDWRRLGHHYDGPIDDPHLVAGLGAQPLLDAYQISKGRSVGETHLFQHLINGFKSPYARKDGGGYIATGPFHHAFHFDQALAGKYLKSKTKNVSLIDDQVSGVETGPQGITALCLEGGQSVAADFFVDCSGFRRVLMQALGAKWVSFSQMLALNRAMPFWLDYAPDEKILPVTTAWAQGSGWMWQIPTASRFGCGYVYSDAHISADQAKAEIEAALGRPIEVRADIKIDPGRQDRTWIGNCVSVGLASSFLEPLEATSIHGTVVQLMLLAGYINNINDKARDQYNAEAARQVEDYRDFVRMHYVSERRDTAFWRDVTANHPDVVKDRLALWSRKIPEASDFVPFPQGLPHVEQQLYTPVLDGLGLLRRPAAGAMLGAQSKPGRIAQSLITEYRAAASQAMDQRAFLQSLHEEPAL